jgi:hypothetical protein
MTETQATIDSYRRAKTENVRAGIFPFGTLLAVYTYWFFMGRGGKQIYGRQRG